MSHESPSETILEQLNTLAGLLGGFPPLISPVTKIVEAFLRHDDPVAEAERQAEMIAAKAAIRLPFKEHK